LANRQATRGANAGTNQRAPTGITRKGANCRPAQRAGPGTNRGAALLITHIRAAGHRQQRYARKTCFQFASHGILLGDC
jgi:hypothetical protein